VRAWQWAGYAVRVRYTYLLDLPVDLQRADQSVRNRYRRALDDGYVCRRADNMADVMACLSGTEERKGLHLALMRADLERAAELMGGECLRTFVCYSPEGKPVSTQVLLFVPGAPALDWLAGTLRTHLHRGVSQLLTKHAFDDVHACGAASIDLVGANIPSVSTAKANWGARLVPFFRIEPQGFPQVFRNLKEWVHFHRGLSLPANGSPAENGKATAQARLKHTPAGAATPRAR